MHLKDKEKYLRALPNGYSVTVEDFGKEMDSEFRGTDIRYLRLCSGIKIEDGVDAMLVDFSITITSPKIFKQMSTVRKRIPYNILTCETIRVMKAILPKDIYPK